VAGFDVVESSAHESLRGVENLERIFEELRDRAPELEIEGRSAMSKDQLVAALRQHAK
jgi:hypothetical protein